MKNLVKIIAFIGVISFLTFTSFLIHKFGKPEQSKMDDYFIQNSQKERATNNVVAAVLFDYRGLDTLGETTVLFAAIIGASLLFVKRGVRENE